MQALDRRRFEGRMYDRLGGLVPRLALTSHRPERRNLMRDALAGLRIGLTCWRSDVTASCCRPRRLKSSTRCLPP